MAGTDRVIDPTTRDYVLDETTNSYETSRSARSAVYHSIIGHRGKWAADPEYGSRINELLRTQNSFRTPAVIRDMLNEALSLLIEDGRIAEPEVVIERDKSRVLIEVTVLDLHSGETIDITDLLPFTV